MKIPRLVALLLGLITLAAAGFALAADIPLSAFTAGLAGVMLIATTISRPRSRTLRRMVSTAFLVHAALILVAGALAYVAAERASVVPMQAWMLWSLAVLALAGYMIARRQSRQRQSALLYLQYLRD